MNYEYLLFDLDGTISDPKEGIVRSINHSFEEFGYPCRSEGEIAAHIGPPIDATLRHFTGSQDQQLISAMVATFRERYGKVGYSENRLYPGIRESLAALTAGGCKLGVCTSKRVDFAEQILEMFSIRKIFALVDGGDVGIPKWQQVEKLLSDNRITLNSLMIGDRYIDLTAANNNGIDGAGVLWGYGSRKELAGESPKYIFERTDELLHLLD